MVSIEYIYIYIYMQLLSFVRMSFIKLWECGVHGPYIISGNIYIYIYIYYERERERDY